MKTFRYRLTVASSADGCLVIGVDGARQTVSVVDPLAEEERIRNPVVPRTFSELGLVEQWGSGVRLHVCRGSAAGLAQPQFDGNRNRSADELPLAQRHTVVTKAAEPEIVATITPAATPAVEALSDSRLESKLAAKVFLQLQEQALGKAALAQGLGHRSVSGELHKQISRLLEQGLIAMTIPDKPQSRLQRYRLTPQGQALLSALNTKENPAP